MDSGAKAMLGMTAVVLVAGAIYVGIDQHRRKVEQETPVETTSTSSVKMDPDDNVYLKKKHPDSLADERELIGHTVWISAGGQLDYYKDTGKHVDYAHPAGTLLQNEPLEVKEVFEEVPPKNSKAVFRIPAGKRHVLIGFTMPKAADPKTTYAMVVGNFDSVYNIYSDDLFFYDDPHKLYDYWGPTVWAHIDKHEPTLGMTEREVMMCVGQVQVPHGGTYGNRSITYDNNGHPLDIDFENNKVIKITPAAS
ncbi:hypothetical protein [Granulicella paludicola]|uniref:hypothetical protein n=1 Tax=Granulicella paludicola TaxID=474951 RepID=UPI0021DF8DD8|nr:hypothetical protein [Granulicella paludicola]